MTKYLLALIFLFTTLYAQPLQYPTTKKVNQIDSYFGVDVEDPYRWLENDTAKDVAEWVAAQNKVTFGYLEKIPYRSAIKERLTAIWNYPKYTAPYREGKNYFFSKNDGLQNQSVLYIQRNGSEEPEVFLDPNKLSSDGTVALAGTAFSSDGKTFAYSISRSGSDWREIYTMDVESKKKLTDSLRWIKFSDIAFWKDGFFYSKYDAPSDTSKALSNKNEFHKVYYHKLGTPQSSDLLIYEDKAHSQRLFGCSISDDERFLFLTASEAGKRGNALYVQDMLAQNKTFIPVTESFDAQMNPVTNAGENIIVFSQKDAPNGKLILVDLKNPSESNWKILVPEKTENLSSVATAGGKLFLTYMKDVRPHVYVYSFDGTMEREIPLPIIGSVGGIGGKQDDTFFYFSMTSFTTPATVYRYDIATNAVSQYRKPELAFDVDSYETEQVFYTSKDGAKIPMFLVHKKGIKLDGNNQTWLYGYGGFNIGIYPTFNPARMLWIEQGGIYAVANIRGGNEYGEQWHEAGTQLKKQNVFNDFISAAEYLIEKQYTTPAKLAIEGRSNGGLLVGAVINQRPELFKVACPGVGVMDMLRFQKFTIGWAWTDDYGSSDDPTQFKNLYNYSPLHNIKEGVQYPAVFATTADHDDRVVPAHSFKYMATLQEKYKGENPVLIRIETKAGHGSGKPTTKQIEEWTDMYAFTFWNMGITPKW